MTVARWRKLPGYYKKFNCIKMLIKVELIKIGDHWACTNGEGCSENCEYSFGKAGCCRCLFVEEMGCKGCQGIRADEKEILKKIG